MQRVRPLVRPIDLRTLPIHPVASETRCDVERIAFVGPPAIHAQRENLAMYVPVATGLLVGGLRWIACIVHRAMQRASLDHDVRHNLEVLGVKLIEDRLGVRKDFPVELELAVVGVPTRWTEARS